MNTEVISTILAGGALIFLLTYSAYRLLLPKTNNKTARIILAITAIILFTFLTIMILSSHT